MPLLQDVIKIVRLRKDHPLLFHISSTQLTKIEPHENVDEYGTPLGKIVCATSDDISRDFYALRTLGKVNHAYGEDPRIFIFEQINPDAAYFEHSVSSENFTPIVFSQDGQSDAGFHGEWVCDKSVVPEECIRGIKKDVLERTNALVFTIAKGKKNEYLGIKGNPYVALKELFQKGILISANPDRLVQIGNEFVRQGMLTNQNVHEMEKILKRQTNVFSKYVQRKEKDETL